MSEENKKQQGFLAGFFHIFSAISYSAQGLVAGFRLSLAFRQECFVFVLLCCLLFFFEKPFGVWFSSLFMWTLVMVMELINTALEESLDLISKDFSPVIKVAKDMGSAAVFLLVMANLVGQIGLFWEEIGQLLSIIQFFIWFLGETIYHFIQN